MKDAILNIAERQLMGGGYGALNFGAIAKELDTTRANLHYHFGNKETLAVEVTEAFTKRQIAGFEALRNAHKGDFFGFMAAIDASFWQNKNPKNKEDLDTCTMLALDHDLPPRVRKLSQDSYMYVEKIMVEIIREAIGNGEIREDVEAKREAARAHVLMMGIMTSMQHLPDAKAARKQMSGLLTDWAESLK